MPYTGDVVCHLCGANVTTVALGHALRSGVAQHNYINTTTVHNLISRVQASSDTPSPAPLLAGVGINL